MFYGERSKIIPELSPNTPFNNSSDTSLQRNTKQKKKKNNNNTCNTLTGSIFTLKGPSKILTDDILFFLVIFQGK